MRGHTLAVVPGVLVLACGGVKVDSRAVPDGTDAGQGGASTGGASSTIDAGDALLPPEGPRSGSRLDVRAGSTVEPPPPPASSGMPSEASSVPPPPTSTAPSDACPRKATTTVRAHRYHRGSANPRDGLPRAVTEMPAFVCPASLVGVGPRHEGGALYEQGPSGDCAENPASDGATVYELGDAVDPASVFAAFDAGKL